MDKESEILLQKKVTRLSIVLVSLIFIIKITTAFFTNSLSFFAELSDSIIDIFAVAITFLALKQSQKSADLNHMFGHYKINSLAAMFQGMIIFGLYGWLFIRAIINITNLSEYKPENSIGAAFSIFVSLIIVFLFSRIITSIGKKTQNPLIIAQSANFRGDLYRNISVFIGLLIVSWGVPIIDVIVALLFSAISIREAGKIIHQSFFELTDAHHLHQGVIEKVSGEISIIKEIVKLDSIKIKTAGNQLDALISITLDRDKKLYDVEGTTFHIKELLADNFPQFECHTSIILNTSGILDIVTVKKVIEIIKQIGEKNTQIFDLHNIQIDRENEIFLISLHITVNQDISLEEAHKIASEFETEIENEICISLNLANSEMEIITHIEPDEKENSHSPKSLNHNIPHDFEESIGKELANFEFIKEYKNLKILKDEHYFYISLIILLDPKKTIKEVHHICEIIEHILYMKFPNLKRCIVHTEPY